MYNFSLKASLQDALGWKVNWLVKWFDVCVIPTLGNPLARLEENV